MIESDNYTPTVIKFSSSVKNWSKATILFTYFLLIVTLFKFLIVNPHRTININGLTLKIWKTYMKVTAIIY